MVQCNNNIAYIDTLVFGSPTTVTGIAASADLGFRSSSLRLCVEFGKTLTRIAYTNSIYVQIPPGICLEPGIALTS